MEIKDLGNISGINEELIASIQQVFERNWKIDSVVLFGSRAKGNYREDSDIDLAVKGRNITFDDILELSGKLDELKLPYEIDLVNYFAIQDKDVVEHIDRVGVVFYEKWKDLKLQDIADVIKNIYTPDGSDNYIYIGMEHIEQNSLRLSSIGISSDVTSSKFLFKQNDVLFGKLRPYFRKVVKPKFSGICSTDIWVLRSKQGIDQNYLFYFLANNDFINVANSGDGGTRMPRADWGYLKTTNWLIPPLDEQKAIAAVLSSLDDKIDLLQRQNKTLEALAETLFAKYFILNADESWRKTNLYDEVLLVGGGTPKTSVIEYWDGEINWLSGGDIAKNHRCFITESEKSITKSGLEHSSATLLPKYATVISARGTVGKYCLLSKPMAFSQSNYGIKPKHTDCYFFTYLLIANSVKELQSAAYGSVFDTITTNTFKEHSIVLPSDEEIEVFEQEIKPYFYKMINNQLQIKSLKQLRDSLLPKLMSGEVRVKNVN